MKIAVSACLLGENQIYDGSFTGKFIPGQGLFTALLKKNGIKVIDVEDLDDTPGQG